jgi:hypothetical protein
MKKNRFGHAVRRINSSNGLLATAFFTVRSGFKKKAMPTPLILFLGSLFFLVSVWNRSGLPDTSGIPREQVQGASDCAASTSSTHQNPFFAFEKTTETFDSRSKGWHREYETNNSYAETWFFMVQTKQGGVLFVTLSISNLGMRTFDGACDVRFYAASGDRYDAYAQYRRKDISGARDHLDLTIGPNRLVSNGRTYHLKINEEKLQLDMTMINVLPEFQFGNGRVLFYRDRSAAWNIRFNAPRAATTGTITVAGKTLRLDGDGYHDHIWSTIKLPTFADKWYSLRLYDKRFSIILHQIHLTDKFGGGKICAGIIGDKDRLIPFRRFSYQPLKWRKDETSGLPIPEALALSIKKDGYTIDGTIEEARFLDSIDVLGRLSWSTRALIKTFYTRPYLVRYQAWCDIQLTDNSGARHPISGLGVVGSNFY